MPPLPADDAARLANDELYWRAQLTGAPALLELPLDRPRPATQSLRGRNCTFAICQQLTGELRRFSRREGTTLFIMLLGGFQALLARYTGATDISVGILDINTLVMRTRLDGDPDFRELTKRVHEIVLQAYAHRDLPFERLVEALSPDRDTSYSPLFQVMFVLHDPSQPQSLARGEPQRSAQEDQIARFDLTLEIEEKGDGLTAVLNYDQELFDAGRIARMAGHYQTLLAAAVAEPSRRVSELPILSEGERRQFAEWNETREQYPKAAFPELISQTPERVAVECQGRSWTYAELDARSNAVAAHLRARGVNVGTLVGILGERSLETMAGLLGIWKAGGAYVPIDPEYPEARQAFIRRDAGLNIVLSKGAIADAMEQPAGPFPSLLTPESTAYVLYTSGSTGAPKGVMVPHRSLVNFLFAAKREIGFDESDVIPAIATLSFDIATLEWYLPLLVGARVVIAPAGVARDGFALRELVERVKPTVLQATPSTWSMLVEAGWHGGEGMRLLSTGEALPRAMANDLLKRRATLFNLYGPTETNYSSVARIEPGDGPVPVGRPLANVRFEVLDRAGQPVPVGIPGELYIAGDNVTQGYLNQPELTARKFGERGFRTGDLVRFRPDGELEFLRRLDDQVKVRGYRIELGEIEAALSAQDGMKQCAALVRQDRLIAYVAAAGLTETGLREALEKTLPGYMVPSRFVLLDALPMTPNGKIDRRRLPEPGEREIAVRPRTPLEAAIAKIFADVLGMERVSVDDDFFRIGGHSLLATRVASRIRRDFGIELRLRTLFEAPNVAALARFLEGAQPGESGPPLRAYPRASEGPVSFAQQRLWFLDRLFEDRDPIYNISQAAMLTGNLDVRRLRVAFDALAERHETLRTGFREIDGVPRQEIAEPGPVDFAIQELADEAELAAQIGRESLLRFDLSRGSLLRVRVYRLAAQRHALLIVLHHIVSDGWSLDVMFRELGALYEGQQLPALPIQYSDYAKWQREWLTGERLDRQESYWRSQLADAPPLLELPLDRPRPAKQTFHAGRHEFSIGEGLTEGLRTFSQREGATLFMTLLSGFQALLVRYAGALDVSVGTPIANRTRVETESLIGFFVNTLVIRTRLDGEPSFRELVARVRETALQAYAHQDLPFERLVELLAPDRGISYTPLVQAMFLLRNEPAEPMRLDGLEAEPLEQENSIARFDLTLETEEREGRIDCVLNFNRDLFDHTTIERMAGHFHTLLRGAIGSPDARVSELQLLSDAERSQLLTEWNDVSVHYLQTATLPELFEAQAERVPENIAVCYEDAQWTYAELNRRANQLAYHLRALGVGPETLVGICVERSLEMLVGILGILKAGGAYVPVDLVYPPERQAFMMEDARVGVLVTQFAFASDFPAAQAIKVCLDTDWPAIATQPDSNPPRAAEPENAAYVIYTSGSTGRPKGVVVTHANVVRLFGATGNWFSITNADTWTLFHSFAFDFSVWEIWGALLYGGRLVVVPRLTSQSPDLFHELLVRERVTILNQTPSAFQQLITADERSGRSAELALRYVIFGGEALEYGMLLPWIERHGHGPELINMYGITETTVHVTYFKIPTGEVGEGMRGLIGRPIPDLQLYILDRHLQPVPIGVPGEMYVGGDGVARGYLNRPELTEERFIASPFNRNPEARLYKTGDVARFRPDGNVQYVGRADFQVKLRGFRIELGEIESVLLRHPGVRECVAVASEERLIGYVVPSATPVPAAELSAWMRERLPHYMVPAALVELARFPLTANGKVDRKALPAPGRSRTEGREYVAPRTPLERTIAGIWEKELKLDRVGVDDNFFELGGHSMLAVRVFASIQQATGKRVRLDVLFNSPTVARIAAKMEAAGSDSGLGLSSIRPCRTEGSKPPVYAVHGIGGTVLSFRGLAAHLDPDQPIYCLEAFGSETSWTTLEELAALYVKDVLDFQPRGPYYLVGSSFGGMLIFEMARQLHEQGHELGFIGMLDSGNMGARNTWTPDERRERTRLEVRHFFRRIGAHAKRLFGSKLEDWPSYSAGRVFAARLRVQSAAWRVLFRFYKAPSALPSRRRNMHRVFELAGRNYIPKKYTGKITLFLAKDEPHSSHSLSTLLDWNGWAEQGVESIEVPGDHSTLVQEPHVRVLASEITKRLSGD